MVYLFQTSLSRLQAAEFQHRFALSVGGLMHGAWWQLLSYQFLHGGLMHLVLNLLFLHSFGPVLEQTMGRRKYLALYLFSGAFGGLIHTLAAATAPQFMGDPPVVGASASLCGLLAALCALYADEQIEVRLLYLFPVVMRAKYLLLVVALVSIAGTVLPLGNVAHFAHLGGLVGGLVCLNLIRVDPLPPAEQP